MSNPENKSNVLDFLVNSVYGNFPEDLRERMIKSADQIMDIGVGDKMRGEWVGDWSMTAIGLYKLLGVSEKEIKLKVQKRLDKFLRIGRQMGLSQMDNIKLLTGDFKIEPEIILPDFESKYNLAHFRELKKTMGVNDRYQGRASSSYKLSLDYAFDLANEIKDDERALEVIVHMIKLGNEEATFKTVEELGANRMLINVGLLYLSDFFDERSNYNTNQLYYGIEALKRVQGKEKTEAEEILHDLAMAIIQPEFIKKVALAQGEEFEKTYKYIKNKLHEDALIAMRATGELKKKIPIDSIRFDYITKVNDTKYITTIRNLLKIVEKESLLIQRDEVRKSLEAISDIEALNEEGEKILRKIKEGCEFEQENLFFSYRNALNYLEAAGNIEKVKEVLDECVFVEFGSFGHSFAFLPLAIKINYAKGLENIIQFSNTKIGNSEDDSEACEWERIKEKAERALKGELAELDEEEMKISNSLPPKDLAPQSIINLLAEEARAKIRIEEYKSALTEEKKEALIKQGYSYFEQRKYWEAFQSFGEALYRKGLIEAGDKMLGYGDGLNAKRPFIYAALLKPEVLKFDSLKTDSLKLE